MTSRENDLLVCEGPSFWRTVKRNIEETDIFFFTMSSKVFVDSDATKGSQDERTN